MTGADKEEDELYTSVCSCLIKLNHLKVSQWGWEAGLVSSQLHMNHTFIYYFSLEVTERLILNHPEENEVQQTESTEMQQHHASSSSSVLHSVRSCLITKRNIYWRVTTFIMTASSAKLNTDSTSSTAWCSKALWPVTEVFSTNQSVASDAHVGVHLAQSVTDSGEVAAQVLNHVLDAASVFEQVDALSVRVVVHWEWSLDRLSKLPVTHTHTHTNRRSCDTMTSFGRVWGSRTLIFMSVGLYHEHL